jgi:hypothetical protein
LILPDVIHFMKKPRGVENIRREITLEVFFLEPHFTIRRRGDTAALKWLIRPIVDNDRVEVQTERKNLSCKCTLP